MIIIRMRGGIGNQIFQYAFGRRLAIENDVELRFDVSWYRNGQSNFPLSIRNYNIQIDEATLNDIDEVVPMAKAMRFNSSPIKHLMQKFARKYPRASARFFNYYFELQNIGTKRHQWATRSSFYKNFLDVENGYFDGYWQTPEYWAPIEDTIREELSTKAELGDQFPILVDRINSSRSVSIHVRGGDINPDNRLTSAYYRNAIEYISSKINDPTYFIFTDEPEFAERVTEFIPGKKYYPSRKNTSDYEDLLLMSLCEHNIIAASTFGWWGAWLNQNPKKIVISPTPWRRNVPITKTGLIPKDWIRVSRD